MPLLGGGTEDMLIGEKRPNISYFVFLLSNNPPKAIDEQQMS